MTLITIFLILGWINAAWGAELTGREVAERMDAVDTSVDSQRIAVMVIHRGEQKLIRRLKSFRKAYGPNQRSLMIFHHPADVRDLKYLTWSYADPQQDDDLWLFLPSQNLVRRISGNGKKGSFMRSDLANEDIEKREIQDDEQRLLRRERFSGMDCYVVEFIPVKQQDTNYSKRVTWVNPETWLPVKTEYYNTRGKHIKTTVFGGAQKIDGIWTNTKLVVETPARSSKTLFQYSDVHYNVSLPDTLFTHSQLKR